MGLMLGKITVETPKYELVHACPDYEIRKYAPSVVAEVTYSPSAFGGDRDGGFRILADYIGALGAPRNAKPEKIAMTAPVVTKTSAASEKIAMTAPVVTKTSAASEKIAMTAPVITGGGGGGGGRDGEAVTMQFVLPAKYRAAAEAPRPLDERVVVKEEAERKYAVARFSGVATEKVVAEKVQSLKKSLERDGYKITGEFLLGRYNPPWTLPPLRTNEVMIPVE